MDVNKIAEKSVRLRYQRSGDSRVARTEEARKRELDSAGRPGSETAPLATFPYGKGQRVNKRAALLTLMDLLGEPHDPGASRNGDA